MPSDGIKLHTKGRLQPGSYAKAEDDVISFTGGGSVALVKLVEPVSPMLNYFEYEILERGEECAIGIGVGAINYPSVRERERGEGIEKRDNILIFMYKCKQNNIHQCHTHFLYATPI